MIEFDLEEKNICNMHSGNRLSRSIHRTDNRCAQTLPANVLKPQHTSYCLLYFAMLYFIFYSFLCYTVCRALRHYTFGSLLYSSSSFSNVFPQVILSCGHDNQLVSVTEPSRCEYRMEFKTPSMCQDHHTVHNEHQEL